MIYKDKVEISKLVLNVISGMVDGESIKFSYGTG